MLCHIKGMQGNETPFDGQKAAKLGKTAVFKRTHAPEPYQKVLDGRKRPIRGLWIRGSRYYARIAVEASTPGTSPSGACHWKEQLQ